MPLVTDWMIITRSFWWRS